MYLDGYQIIEKRATTFNLGATASSTSSLAARSSASASSASRVSSSSSSAATTVSASLAMSSSARMSSSGGSSSRSAVVPTETVPPNTANADTGSGAKGSSTGGGHLTVIVVCSVLGAIILGVAAWRLYVFYNNRKSARRQLPPASGSTPSYASLAGFGGSKRSHSSDLKEMASLPTSSSRMSFIPKQTHSSQSFPSAGQAYMERPSSPSVTSGNGNGYGGGSPVAEGGRHSHASNRSLSNLGAVSPTGARTGSNRRASLQQGGTTMMGAPHMPYGRRDIITPQPLGPPSLGQTNFDSSAGQGFGDVLGFRPDTFARTSESDRARRSSRYESNSRQSVESSNDNRRFGKSKDLDRHQGVFGDDDEYTSRSPVSTNSRGSSNARAETQAQQWRPPSQHLDEILRR